MTPSFSNQWGLESVETRLAPLIRNAEATLVELHCGATVVPMIVPDLKLMIAPGERCSVTCMESAAIGYVIDEWVTRHQPSRPQLTLIKALGLVSSCGPWRRAVQVGSLPFTTTPRSPETEEALWKVLPDLRERMPDRPFIVRSILDGRLPRKLPKDATILPSWVDYRWDFSQGQEPRAHNYRADRNHFRKSGLIIIEDEDFDESRVAEGLVLYEKLYRQRHSLRNPRFTHDFIAMSRARGWISLCGLVDPGTGKLVGLGDRKAINGVSIPAFIGYDTATDQQARHYRNVFAMLGEGALERQLHLNMTSGAGAFKRLRGYLPTLEQSVVFPALAGPRRISDRAVIALRSRMTRDLTVERMIAAGG